jgi:hypothetical protein
MATANVSTEVVGVKEALRELNQIDKRARRQITRRFREIMKPTLSDAQSLLPAKAPMSGWERYWNPQEGLQRGSTASSVLPWSTGNRRRIEAFVSGSRPKEIGGVTKGLAAFGVRWKGPQAVLFDMSQDAKTRQGQQMVDVLRERFGDPSRVMWKAWERTDDEVEGQIAELVEDVMRATGRRIKAGN